MKSLSSFLSFILVVSLCIQSYAQTVDPILDATAIQDGRDGRKQLNPCEDFYQFACGGWIEKTEIPEDKNAVYRMFTNALDSTDLVLNKILKAYAAGDFSIPAPQAVKLAAHYNSCMNNQRPNPTPILMVKKQLALIDAAQGKAEFARLIGRLHRLGVNALFRFGSSQDLNDSERVIGFFLQGGLGLPNKTYYLDQDDKAKETRAKYSEYIATLFEKMMIAPKKSRRLAEEVLAFEAKMAEKSYSIEEEWDPSLTNHPMRLAELSKLAPHFSWDEYLQTAGLMGDQDFNMSHPKFFEQLNALLDSESPALIKAYLKWQFINTFAVSMGGAYEQLSFDFWQAYLAGAKKPLPRWKQCTQSVATDLNYALAEAYVQTFDGAAILQKTESMIAEIEKSFSENLVDLSQGPEAWFDQETYEQALLKLSKVSAKLGAPSNWRDYSGLDLVAHNFLLNTFRIRDFDFQRDIAKIGKPVDKTEWFMMPWEVNAYYSRSDNQFNFPFGILQPPSLDLTASDGANYGAFGGGTIGHELLHGFDKDGAKYDADGNVRNWWSKESGEQFAKRAQCYVEQAEKYLVKEVGLFVKGEQVRDENLSDQGGVKLGYHALDRILSSRPETFWNGYSERQQYWLAYAQSWCSKFRPESLRKQLLTDEHPPSEFRVNAVMMNRPEFAKDFQCKVGEGMRPVHQCSLW